LVTCGSRMPSVELGALIPLSLVEKRGMCELNYKNEMLLTLSDIVWCDVLLLVRGTSFQSLWIANSAKKLHRTVLGYWDDDLLNVPDYSLSYRYHSSPRTKKNVFKLFEITDQFFSPNNKLATKLSALHGKEVQVLPVPFGPEKLRVPSKRTRNLPIVGYAGGRDHIKLVNTFLGPVLSAVVNDCIDFNVHIIGPKPKFDKKLKARTKYDVPIRNYYAYLDFTSHLHWDIGLAPQVNTEFTTYKFYNKLLEYTAMGCAGIYSKLEPYTGVIQDGITGLLVDNEVDAWRDAILRLLKDPELRFKIASNAYDLVKSSNNRKLVAEKYISALEPFLDYRAPDIKKPFVYFSTIPIFFARAWNLVIEDVRTYGVFAVIKALLGYLLRLVFGRNFKVKKYIKIKI